MIRVEVCLGAYARVWRSGAREYKVKAFGCVYIYIYIGVQGLRVGSIRLKLSEYVGLWFKVRSWGIRV